MVKFIPLENIRDDSHLEILCSLDEFSLLRILLGEGCTDFYVIEYYKEENKRFKGFSDSVKVAGYKANYIQLTSSNGIRMIGDLLSDIKPTTGLFISDYSSAYILDSLCSRDRVIPKHILVFDTDTELFYSQYLPPIRTVGPSFVTLGQELGKCLIYKWLNGAYSQPLQMKI